MRQMLVAAGLAAVLSGCSTTQVAETLVDRYCAIDPAERALIRLRVNRDLFPRTVAIDCADSWSPHG